MRDPRIDEYARLLVERSVGVQPGWQVFVRGARRSRGRCSRRCSSRSPGAAPTRSCSSSFEQIGGPFAREAPLEVLRVPAPLLLRIWEEFDAFISISAPENAREGSDLSRGAARGSCSSGWSRDARADDGDGRCRG